MYNNCLLKLYFNLNEKKILQTLEGLYSYVSKSSMKVVNVYFHYLYYNTLLTCSTFRKSQCSLTGKWLPIKDTARSLEIEYSKLITVSALFSKNRES